MARSREQKRLARQRRKELRRQSKLVASGRLVDAVAEMEAQEALAKNDLKPKPIEARTEAQGHYIISIKNNQLTYGVGPAGTGKTFICGALAAEALENQQTEKIVITRPVVEAGEELGFLPGDIEEKFAPYFQPFKDVLIERLGKGKVEYLMKAGKIEAAPLAYMRGRTFKNAWVILDEAQNTTPTQMKLFLTRLGENCRVIVNGDIAQKDIKCQSGLIDAIRRTGGLNQVGHIQFTKDDVVRSGLVQAIVEAYEDEPQSSVA